MELDVELLMFPQLVPSVYRFVVIRLKSNFIEVEVIEHLSVIGIKMLDILIVISFFKFR